MFFLSLTALLDRRPRNRYYAQSDTIKLAYKYLREGLQRMTSARVLLVDVRQGYVSLEAAAREYGVVIDPKSMKVNRAATEARRKEMQT